MKGWKRAVLPAVMLCALAGVANADDGESLLATVRGVDTLWVLVAAFLVFFMQAGFGMVEAGFIRAKNACNILTKNFLDYCVASIMFFLVGYAFMFGTGGSFIGLSGFGMDGAANPSGVSPFAFWLFQAAFCGAAATIVAGGMAERMKFHAYLLYTAVISAVIYPIVGHWVWSGEGWLAGLGFGDFAGSTVVHATGGWAAFVGTVVLGPRIGKFGADGRANAIPGHSIPLAALGVFLLWFGWFGFNPGSTLSVGDGNVIGRVAMNTNLAACAGAILAMVTVWALYGKPDLSMTMNGALAGLVAITAPCAFVSGAAAIAIGAVGGVVVVLGVALLDRVGVDDPVGAVPVHGMNGVWGTLSVGIWGRQALGLARDGLLHGGGAAQLGVQALGAVCVSLFVVASMGLVFLTIRKTVGLRVSKAEELRGLDIGEHGMEAYAGFQVFTTQ
ncbi:MAG: ammonium transporter [Planctomycetes bacterium SM23_32]|nr:MAG: ammonium transporter [Planctomycetes bacterium SM23_32]